jgi:large subunit ribosomal protein L22
MEVKSVLKYARMSDQKVREVTRAIQGMPVSQAISVLNFTPKKAAVLIGKTLRSAISNAENNHELDADDLYIKSAVATKGPTLGRIMPRARGSAGAIKKRMSHITLILATKEKAEEAEAPKAAKKVKAKATA